MEKFEKNTKILIVGLGLMGGSYAKALSKGGYAVRAVSREQEDIDFAVGGGFLESGSTEPKKELLEWADLVVLALYPHTVIEWVDRYAALLKEGTVVTDVTGVKGSVVEKVQEKMPAGVEFIAAHPMAGRERSGVVYSDDSVFRGANYIVVPTARNTEKGIEICEKLGEALGFYRISRLDVDSHDRMVALLSQLTHCIAVALMCACDTPGLETYTGDSFRDLTRIAKINDEMWSELFLWNKQALLTEMDRFSWEFAKLRQTLAAGDQEKMREMMRLSKDRREKFDKPSDQTVLWSEEIKKEK